MLDKHIFLKGLKILNVTYKNFNFDLTDKDALNIWYARFQNLSNAQFENMINTFLDNNNYPPNSPKELLDIIKTDIRNNEMSADEAWNKVRELNQRYGFNYGRNKILKAVEDNEALYKTILDFEYELKFYKSDDTYLPKQFKDSYNINLKKVIDNKLKATVSGVLDYQSIKQLGDGNEQ